MTKLQTIGMGIASIVLTGLFQSPASAQAVPGFQLGGSYVNPYTGSVTTIQQSYNPIWGTQSYQSYVNPFTGFSVERQYSLSPFGNYQSAWIANPYPYSQYGYAYPYWGTGYPYTYPYGYRYNTQIAAYNYGIQVNRMRSHPNYWR